MPIEQQRQPQAEQELGADCEEREHQRVPQAHVKLLVGGEPQEIVDAGKLPGEFRVRTYPRRGSEDHVDGWKDRERHQHDHGRSEHQHMQMPLEPPLERVSELRPCREDHRRLCRSPVS